jgi:hypothetical protein
LIVGVSAQLSAPKIHAGNVSTGSQEDFAHAVESFDVAPEERVDPAVTMDSTDLSWFARWRKFRASRTAELERARHLQREIRDYATDADRRDFEAVLDRYPDRDTQLLRNFLTAQHVPFVG